MDQERAVFDRYQKAAKEKEPSLCCPISYNAKYLAVIPDEIMEKDYGCGDPSPYVREGEIVLDLGSGAGKLCYIIAQVVGPKGKVIGVDMNREMLALARKYVDDVAKRIGYKNVEFCHGKIQNLKLDLEKLEMFLKENPIKDLDDYLNLEFTIKELEKTHPLIKDCTIDVVVSNCVLNLVRDDDKKNLFKEIFRVLKERGRAVISDIVSDKDVPDYMKEDPILWSGCISGAMREDLFIKAFYDAGFKVVDIIKKTDEPWQVVDGIRFYSITIAAYKTEKNIIYKSCCGNSFIFMDFTDRIKLLSTKLSKDKIDIVQVNVGNLCNQLCTHCHVDGSPENRNIMSRKIIDKIINLLEENEGLILDITGGAPELNPHVNYMIEKAEKHVSQIIFRTNLTALHNNLRLINFLSQKGVKIFASLPSAYERETDTQRGEGAFKKSIEVLRFLNEYGYGKDHELNIVYNPIFYELPEEKVEKVFRRVLKDEYNIEFNELLALINVPIGRFEKKLKSEGKYEDYIDLLFLNFNEESLSGIMCRRLINIGYDGKVYDCDFNNSLNLSIGHIDNIDFKSLKGRKILVGNHCYACTAKRGSSCFGSVVK